MNYNFINAFNPHPLIKLDLSLIRGWGLKHSYTPLSVSSIRAH